MHARALNGIERADGAGKLALQRAQMIDVLNEAGGAESFLLVENFIADRSSLRQAFARKHHAQLADLVGRHADDGAVGVDLIGNLHAVELLPDGGGVLLVQFVIKQRQRRGGDAGHQEAEEAEQGGGDDDDSGQAGGAEIAQGLQKSVHLIDLLWSRTFLWNGPG